MAGRLTGFLDGRPVSLVAENREISLVADNMLSLLKLRKGWRYLTEPLSEFFQKEDIILLVKINWLGKVQVFPRPSYLLRFLLP